MYLLFNLCHVKQSVDPCLRILMMHFDACAIPNVHVKGTIWPDYIGLRSWEVSYWTDMRKSHLFWYFLFRSRIFRFLEGGWIFKLFSKKIHLNRNWTCTVSSIWLAQFFWKLRSAAHLSQPWYKHNTCRSGICFKFRVAWLEFGWNYTSRFSQIKCSVD